LGFRHVPNDGEQVERAARQSVDAGDRHYVAGGEGLEQFEEFAPVAVRARYLLAVNLGAARAAYQPPGCSRLDPVFCSLITDGWGTGDNRQQAGLPAGGKQAKRRQ
jgi:hypothetical protein